MAFLGRWEIDDLLTFAVNTHTPSTGAATDADAVPAYRVYEDETGTAILTGNMAKLDDANTTGFYSEQITLSAANGFEVGKSYTVYVSAVVGGVTGTLSHSFQVELAPATAAAMATVQADTDDIQTRLPAALIDGRIRADVLAIDSDPDAAFQLQQAAVNLANLANLDAAVSTRSTLTAADVWANATRTLTSFGTLVADIWSYVTRTLTSGGATAAEIWDYLTSAILTTGSIGKLIKDKLGLITTATEITVDAPVNGGMATITKAVTFDSGLLDVTVPAGWTKCLVTGKKDKDDPDTAALFQIVESNPGVGTDGLLYLNGAAGPAAQGSVTVDEGNNQVSFSLTDNATAQLPRRSGHWDIKFLKSDGSSTRPVAGLMQIVLPVTLTI